ncbi:PDR/VanB family oxidoreductase [Roseivivax isoporae]|uniref:Vanillate O-demethylase n=1 Tax=Roseivivax isoporae LMG 25204 TaxID=1449351 RepID=X7FE05_9RHOB|nr:PDR/VanB family oxidoreductase [Roseivivax isoporae]ETX30284.1 vanillate O-demethylase [Roseivivax isoporae LMG 25204]
MSVLDLVVTRAEPAGDMIRLVELARPDGGTLPAFEAGAHVEIHLPDGDTRPYSLIDLGGEAAAPALYRFGVRLEAPGRGGSAYMHGLSAGDPVRVDAPKNDFPLDAGDAPAVLVAGGIGVTPIVSMAAALKAAGRSYVLHYAARSRAAAALADHLAEAHGDALSLHLDDTAGGPLDLAAVMAAADPASHVYICGPKPMIEAARRAAEAAGIPSARIHVELFESAAAPAAGDAPFEVELASSGKVYTIPPGRSIIEVLEEAGEDLIYDCQRGDCGICQTDVLEGEPDHRDVVLSEDERASGKVMQICVSRAKSARLKLDL